MDSVTKKMRSSKLEQFFPIPKAQSNNFHKDLKWIAITSAISYIIVEDDYEISVVSFFYSAPILSEQSLSLAKVRARNSDVQSTLKLAAINPPTY